MGWIPFINALAFGLGVSNIVDAVKAGYAGAAVFFTALTAFNLIVAVAGFIASRRDQ